jgi:hypothetical protein
MSVPGWYPDPSDPSRQRYFDGKTWTEKYAPPSAPSPAVSQPEKPPMGTGLKIGLGVGAAALLVAALASISTGGDKTSSSSSTTVTVTKTVVAPPTTTAATAEPSTAATAEPSNPAPRSRYGPNGAYAVGRAQGGLENVIPPGRYQATGDMGILYHCASVICQKSMDNPKSRDNIDGDIPVIVEIPPTDVAIYLWDVELVGPVS